jgi:hypothetical protein
MNSKPLNTNIIFTLVLVSVFLITSCKKKEKETEVPDTDTSAAYDQALGSSIVDNITRIADEAGRTHTVSCASLRFDTLAAVKTITVGFSGSCVNSNGITQSGSLVLRFNGSYGDSLTVITVTFQGYTGYFINDQLVQGSQTITNKGHNAANHLVYGINSNMYVNKSRGGGLLNWNSTLEREWTTGETTLTQQDDIYSITGVANGTSSNDNAAFQSTITGPLIRNMTLNCTKYFTSGVIAHTPAGKVTRYINYGTGGCNNLSVLINGNFYAVSL